MKKFLMLFITILSLSFIFSAIKTHAQEPMINYPNSVMLVPFNFLHEPIKYQNSYEFLIDYKVEGICINNITQNNYFLVNEIGINFQKGIDRNKNSYKIRNVWCSQSPPALTWITLKVNVLESLANSYNYPENDKNIELLFSRDTALYIFAISIRGTIDYDIGYHEGFINGYTGKYIEGYENGYCETRLVRYDEGYNKGYKEGYNIGYSRGVEDVDREASYQDGYNEGYQEGSRDKRFKFIANIHTWIIPAIILVFSLSIYISYRKGRNNNE